MKVDASRFRIDSLHVELVDHDLHEPGRFTRLEVTLHVPDRVTGLPSKTKLSEVIDASVVRAGGERLANAIVISVRQALVHEVYEQLRFDGVAWRDPHDAAIHPKR